MKNLLHRISPIPAILVALAFGSVPVVASDAPDQHPAPELKEPAHPVAEASAGHETATESHGDHPAAAAAEPKAEPAHGHAEPHKHAEPAHKGDDSHAADHGPATKDPHVPATKAKAQPKADDHAPVSKSAPKVSKKSKPAESSTLHELPAPAVPEELSASNNTLLSARPSEKHAEDRRVEQGRVMIEGALKYKKAHNLAMAETLLASLINQDPPEEVQRMALRELAQIAVDSQKYSRAQQIYSQYTQRFPQDPSTAEIQLRQGLLFRQMGAYNLAIAKFYAVMSSAITLRDEKLEEYKNLVLLAQTEVADTYSQQGDYRQAASYYRRVLKLDHPQVNEPRIRHKLVHSLSQTTNLTDVIAEGQLYLDRCPTGLEQPEVRYLMASALQKLGRTQEALLQTFALLTSEQSRANPTNWAIWQQRTGNELANQLYQQGDYVSAIQVYDTLARIQETPAWQMPAWYQIGLAYERLGQQPKAIETYDRILDRSKEVKEPSASLKLVIDMARWRKDHLGWTASTAQEARDAIAGRQPAPVGSGASGVSLVRRAP
jgi:tetratricopeptide (TPR) repeat protein